MTSSTPLRAKTRACRRDLIGVDDLKIRRVHPASGCERSIQRQEDQQRGAPLRSPADPSTTMMIAPANHSPEGLP